MKRKTTSSKSRLLWCSFLLGIIIILNTPFPARAAEEYRFERMWPTLQQPWYFADPFGVAVDDNGFIYVADTYNNRIQKFTSDGQFVLKWGKDGSGDGEFQLPYGVAIDGNGYVYVADTDNHRIQKFTADGQFIAKWGNWGESGGEFIGPSGIVMDGSDNVYVADTYNHRIQKFTTDGQFVASWGSEGGDNGELSYPSGVAVDSSGNIYVADTHNHRIQKFTSTGQFVTAWGSEGNSNGEFFYLSGVAVDDSGNVYVADTENYRIQKLDSGGQFVTAWGSEGSDDGEFSAPSGITVDANGHIFVADTYNSRIQKFTTEGQFLTSSGSQGSGEGRFDGPAGIVMDGDGNVYVVDTWNDRIQKFTSEGQFLTEWGYYGSQDGEFARPSDIAIDANGFVYITDTWNYRIQKFTTDGQFVASWGSEGSGNGEFDQPSGIAIDRDGYIYVADTWNYRIQKFTSEGQFVGKWGSEGTGEGEFIFAIDEGLPSIATDNMGYVYVADSGNDRIQKFTSNGQFVTSWGSEGSGNGEFDQPSGIAIDRDGYIYVADTWNHRIQTFTSGGQFVATWGSFGSEPGSLNDPIDLIIDDPRGRTYISDNANHRIQVFSKVTTPSPGQKKEKAIIVAGSGPFPGNNIWDATEMLANFAYRALTYQGYTKGTIYYLSADTDLDLDGNGIFDDVDADATNSNFQSAITTWAGDAETLFIYLVGHGGAGTFRMGATELLQALELDSWLDTIQGTISGRVIFVYDACRSGSFLTSLLPPSGKERILATSASEDGEALFSSQGSISFSFLFWGRMFNGDSFYDSFVHAKSGISVTYNQNPQLDGNGNGIGNERADQDASRAVAIGNETRTGADIPVIGSVSPPRTLTGNTSALIYAADVIDADGISRVWAVVTPPGFSSASPDTPVTNLPILEMNPVGSNRYEGTYTGFTEPGTYNVALYAMDTNGIISLPKQTAVIQQVPLNVSALETDVTGSPAVNTPVTITFTAQGNTAGTINYQYWLARGYQTADYGHWQMLKDWSPDNTLDWTLTANDHYVVVAYVAEGANTRIFHQAGLSIETQGNSANPIQITGLTTTMNYPQSTGAPITLNTTASGGNGQLYYKYWYCKGIGGTWNVIRDYSTSSTCTWTPTEDGLYTVVVWVTDDLAGFDYAIAGMTCTIGE